MQSETGACQTKDCVLEWMETDFVWGGGRIGFFVVVVFMFFFFF